MKAHGPKIAALLLLLLAAALRLIGLEHNPPGLWQDEASTGVDAYLLWTTGRDRAGAFLPLIAASFGDYPLALYRYLDAPIVGLFGLSVRNERLVAAIAGTLTVASAGLVVLKVVGVRAALATMLAAALSPQWVHFSRYGSEAILMPFTLTTGWALIAWGVDGKRRYLWLGAISLGLSAYTYHAIKIYLPLWMIGFGWFYRRELVRLWQTDRRHLVGPAVLFALIVLPSVVLALTPQGMARGRTVLAWHHAKGLDVVRLILSNYLSYFHLGMLFAHGGPVVAQSIPGVGLWSLIELPLMCAGAVALIRGPHRRFGLFLAFWVILGPLPGGLTFETQNVGRAIGWLPAPHLISGIGMVALLDAARSRVARALVPAALAVGWLATAGWIAHQVFVVYPKVTQRDFQFEVSDALRCAERFRSHDEQLLVSPHFQAADIFARFFYGDLPRLASGSPAWTFADPTLVAEGTLYVFPASRPKPTGRELCRVTAHGSSDPVSFVYGPAEPIPVKDSTVRLKPAGIDVFRRVDSSTRAVAPRR